MNATETIWLATHGISGYTYALRGETDAITGAVGPMVEEAEWDDDAILEAMEKPDASAAAGWARNQPWTHWAIEVGSD